jgi:hypothetical protein
VNKWVQKPDPTKLPHFTHTGTPLNPPKRFSHLKKEIALNNPGQQPLNY